MHITNPRSIRDYGTACTATSGCCCAEGSWLDFRVGRRPPGVRVLPVASLVSPGPCESAVPRAAAWIGTRARPMIDRKPFSLVEVRPTLTFELIQLNYINLRIRILAGVLSLSGVHIGSYWYIVYWPIDLWLLLTHGTPRNLHSRWSLITPVCRSIQCLNGTLFIHPESMFFLRKQPGNLSYIFFPGLSPNSTWLVRGSTLSPATGFLEAVLSEGLSATAAPAEWICNTFWSNQNLVEPSPENQLVRTKGKICQSFQI